MVRHSQRCETCESEMEDLNEKNVRKNVQKVTLNLFELNKDKNALLKLISAYWHA